MTTLDFESNCSFIGDTLRREYGEQVIKILLAGSRARQTAKNDSDWDVILVLKDEPSQKFGPIRLDEKFVALDGNLVEYFRMNDVDFERYKQEGNPLICDADELGVFL